MDEDAIPPGAAPQKGPPTPSPLPSPQAQTVLPGLPVQELGKSSYNENEQDEYLSTEENGWDSDEDEYDEEEESEDETPVKREQCVKCQELDLPEALWRVCVCSPDRAHQACLEAWLRRTQLTACETCGYRYNLRLVASHVLGVSICVWLRDHADTREVLLVLFLSVLVLAEAFLMDAYLSEVTAEILVPPVDGDPREYLTNLLEYWRFVSESWRQFLRQLTLPLPFVALAAAALALQLALLVPLLAPLVAKFRDWYEHTFVLKLVEEPPSPAAAWSHPP
ncbi:uncharacterized protein LOC134531437 isoform X2 [Bacillus rossius redtenbacheri]|uniref:uncharacterized protein LOC134531437 isoform X2 n=1 Tax=Bacillus rossius redtenbacheri TaxID=93214 RepID=UPI002FDCF5C2